MDSTATVRDTQEMNEVNFEELEPVGEIIGEEHIIFTEVKNGKNETYYIGTIQLHEGNGISIIRDSQFPLQGGILRKISSQEITRAGLEIQVAESIKNLTSRIYDPKLTQPTYEITKATLDFLYTHCYFSKPLTYEAHYNRLPATCYIGTLHIIDEDFKLRLVFDYDFYKDENIVHRLDYLNLEKFSNEEINLILYSYLDFLTENSSELSARFKIKWMSICPNLARVKSLIELNSVEQMHEKSILLHHAQKGILPFLNYIHSL